MSDQINRNTMQVFKSVNTPDYPQDIFLNISGKTLPTCDNKYWKIVGEQVVEMTIADKAVVDYVEPIPEPEPPTPEEVEKERKYKIAHEIAMQYTIADEMSMIRKLLTGESKLTDVDIVEWLGIVADAKLKYPEM